jgi:O-antigen/teichoic acid export membrane protein
LFQKIRDLSKNTTIYGLGDVAVSLVSFGLWSVYVKYFDVRDYGVINLLLSMEVIAKIVFRFGLDGAFMRLFYEAEDRPAQQRLASTIAIFLLAVDGAVLAVLLVASPLIATSVLGDRMYAVPLRLMLLNTFLIGFTFIPFILLQIEQRAALFSLMTLLRSVLTVVLRLVLVIHLGAGIAGLYVADLIVTFVTLALLARSTAPLLRPVFSRAVLRDALAFGLPRLPHAAAQQVLAVGDKFVLTKFVSLDNIGVYGSAVSFGLAQKLFLSAFQSAWAPFIFATAKEPDAPRVFRIVTTYGIAVLALLTAGIAAIGRDAVAAMTHGFLLAPDDPRWSDVATVISWTAVGVFLQGVYLLTSIGLNITKRTRYYPIATVTAASVNIVLNFLLIPSWGIIGAAWANAAGYAVQAGLGYMFSQRFYPVAYERGRIARCCAAAVAAYAAARMLPSIHVAVDPRSALAAVPDLLARGLTVVVVFGGLLAMTGFFHADELRWLRDLRRRRGPVAPATHPPDSTETAGEIVATDIGGPD